MIAADSSVVIAGFASWHQYHEAARHVIDRRPVAIGHALIEAYSVLTRLPRPHRAEPSIVRDFIDARFRGDVTVLRAAELRRTLSELPELGISGGKVYDALIATTAMKRGATLATCDARAASTYDRLGCDYELIR